MLQSRGDLDLALKPVGAERCGEMRVKHLDRHGPLVLLVVSEPDGGHATAPDLSLDDVRVAEGGLYLRARVDDRLGHDDEAVKRPSSASVRHRRYRSARRHRTRRRWGERD